MNKYEYEITENGYYIIVNGKKSIHQYEPYIPNHELSYEENAKNQIEQLQISDYLYEIEKENISIEDVPKELKSKVEENLKSIEKAKLEEPASRKDYNDLSNAITETELALAEIYETMLGGLE